MVQRKKACFSTMPRWPLEKSPQPLSGYITLHIGHITGREGVALQGPRQGVALAPEKNDVTRFHIVLSGAHFSSGAKLLRKGPTSGGQSFPASTAKAE